MADKEEMLKNLDNLFNVLNLPKEKLFDLKYQSFKEVIIKNNLNQIEIDMLIILLKTKIDKDVLLSISSLIGIKDEVFCDEELHNYLIDNLEKDFSVLEKQ